MNDSIRIVAKRWYHLYWCILVVGSVLFTGFAVAQRLQPSNALLHSADQLLHFDTTALFIAGLGLVYSGAAFWLLRKKSTPLAVQIASLIFTLLLLDGLVSTDPHAGAWYYSAAWFIITFFSGMFGLAYSLILVMLSVMYVLIQSHFGFLAISSVAWSLIGGTTVAFVTSFFFWRSHFTDSQDAQMSRMSTMLRSNQEQSSMILQSIADGVIVVGTDGKITLINLAAGLMTGWSTADASGVDVQLVVKIKQENGGELPQGANPFMLVLSNHKPLSHIVQVVSRDESVRIVSLVISPVILGKGELAGAVAVMRDVSAERAEEQQRAEFISTASHEMRTPVAAIEGYLALALNDKVSTVDSRGRGFLEKAHASTQHLGKLFQDLLTSAKAEDGRLSNHPVVVEMGALLEQLVEDLRFAAQKKGLSADFVVGTSQSIDATKADTSQKVIKPLYYTHADPERLREVITNLFDNAVKYTEQGRISIGLTGNNDVVQLYIRDTGPGIPPDDIPHLFQKFYRVDNSATRTIGGTGLGLFICRKIIELYHGRIWVESQLGKGSAFFINLPRLTSQRAAALQASEANAVAPPPSEAKP